MTKQCPSCGIGELNAGNARGVAFVPFGPKIDYSIQTEKCSECDATFDAEPENASRVEAALNESAAASVEVMLARLEQAGLRNAYVERALGLPQRTIARWKRGERSATTLALLRILCTFPWVINVADFGFEQENADAEVIAAALRIAKRLEDASQKNVPCSVTILADWRSTNRSIDSANAQLTTQTTKAQYTVTLSQVIP